MEMQTSTAVGVGRPRVILISADATRQHDEECGVDSIACAGIGQAQVAPSQH